MKRLLIFFALVTGFILSSFAPLTVVAQNQTPITLGTPIAGVSSVNNLTEYIALAYRYAIGIAIIAAIVMVVYGGFRYLMGSAGAGNVNRGKEIIRDAIAGMLLVIMAYTILQTVNPATLSLELPTIRRVATEEVAYQEAGADTLSTPLPPSATACTVDRDCNSSRNEACMRLGSMRIESHIATSDEIISGQGGGLCSDGTQGMLCRCVGTGCDRSLCGPGVADLSQYYNNRCTGVRSCQSDLKCLFSTHDDPVGVWVCLNVAIRTDNAVLQAHVQNGTRSCVRDADCGSGNVCIRIDPSASSPQGECANATAATLGQRCKCRGYGCSTFPGVSVRVVGCQEGLECGLYAFNRPDGLGSEWFCMSRRTQTECLAFCNGDTTQSPTAINNCRHECEIGNPPRFF